MALQPLYDSAFKHLHENCQIFVDPSKQQALSAIDGAATIVLTSHADQSDQDLADTCSIIFRSKPRDVQPESFLWRPKHCDIAVEVFGLEKLDPAKRQQNDLDGRLELVFHDLCRFAAECISGCRLTELTIQCDRNIARTLLLTSSFKTSKVRDVCSLSLASAFVFAHLVRVRPGMTKLQCVIAAAKDAHSGCLNSETMSETPLVIISYTPDRKNFEQDFEKALSASTSQSSNSKLFLCIMYNEMELCTWYLQRGLENQRYRLPNHDTSGVCLNFHGDSLRMRVTAFDYRDRRKFSEIQLEDEATLPVNVYKDDDFLSTVARLFRRTAGSQFHLDCVFVPCRSTLHLLDLISEIEREPEAAQQSSEKMESSELSQLLEAAASGDPSSLAALVLKTDRSIVNQRHVEFPRRTALQCAAAASVENFGDGGEGHLACVTELSKCGADISARDGYEQSALHMAVLSGNTDLTKWLLENMNAGEIHLGDNEGRSPLLLAVEDNNMDMVELLLDSDKVCSDAPDNYWDPILTCALQTTSTDLKLIESVFSRQEGLFSDEPCQFKQLASYFWMAWKQDRSDICDFIILRKFGLSEECVLEAHNLAGFIVSGNKDELHRKLTDRNSGYRDREGRTLLMWTAMSCLGDTDVECAKLILKLGGKSLCDAVDFMGDTALHLAAASGNVAVARLLVEFGASALASNFEGETASVVAKQNGQTAVVELLASKKKDAKASPSEKGEVDFQAVLQALLLKINLVLKDYKTFCNIKYEHLQLYPSAESERKEYKAEQKIVNISSHGYKKRREHNKKQRQKGTKDERGEGRKVCKEIRLIILIIQAVMVHI